MQIENRENGHFLHYTKRLYRPAPVADPETVKGVAINDEIFTAAFDSHLLLTYFIHTT